MYVMATPTFAPLLKMKLCNVSVSTILLESIVINVLMDLYKKHGEHILGMILMNVKNVIARRIASNSILKACL